MGPLHHNKANWRMEPAYWAKTAATAVLDRFCRVLEIENFVIAISQHFDDANRPVWNWSIYRGKAEWYSYLVEAVWTPVNCADENEARAAAWSTLVKISVGPGWPPEPEDMATDVFEFPDEPNYRAG